jgi:hypothetical protein
MKLIKNLTLLFTIVIFAACTAGNETLLELDELTLEELEALATVGEEGDPGGGGGPGGGGPSYDLLILAKGKSTNNIHSGRSTDVTGWTNDGTMGGGNLTSRGPAATIFNNNIYAVYKGQSSNYVYYTTSTDGTSWASSSQLPSSFQISKDPGVAVYGSKIYVAARGKTTERVYWAESSNGSSWNYIGHLINDATTSGDVDLVTFNGNLYEFHPKDGSVKYSFYDGTDWSGVHTITGASTSSSPCAVVFNGRMYVFFPGSGDNKIRYTSTANGSTYSSIATLNTNDKSNKRISAAVDGSKLILAFKGNSSNYLYLRYSTNGSSWSIPTGNIIDNGLETNESPTILSF